MSQTARRYRLLRASLADLQARAYGQEPNDMTIPTYRSTGRQSSPDSQTGYIRSTDQRLPLAVDPEATTWGDWVLRAVMVGPFLAVAAYSIGWL